MKKKFSEKDLGFDKFKKQLSSEATIRARELDSRVILHVMPKKI